MNWSEKKYIQNGGEAKGRKGAETEKKRRRGKSCGMRQGKRKHKAETGAWETE